MSETRNPTIAEKHGLISKFLKNMLELGGFMIVHENGTISYSNKPDDPIMMKVKGDNEPRPLVVYRVQTDLPKAIIINPFVEPVGKDPTDKIWFYNTTNSFHAIVFARILEYLFTNVIKAANGGEVDDPNLVHVLSGIVNSADAKTEKEFAKIVKELPEFKDGLDEGMLNEITLITDSPRPKDFITISRSKQERKTILTTFLYNQENDLKKKFGNKIRKKTWALVEKLFQEIYATENIYDPIFVETTDQKRCPSFITYAKVLINSWNKFIPYLQYIYGESGAEEQINKIIFLESMLHKLDDLSGIAHWARGCINGSIQLKNGEQLSNEDDTSMDNRRRDSRPVDVKLTLEQASVTPTRREQDETDEYYTRVKMEADRDFTPQQESRSAMDILNEEAGTRYRRDYGRDDRRFSDRDRRYRDDPPWDTRDDRDYDSRYRRDTGRGSSRGNESRSAMEILDAERNYNRGLRSGFSLRGDNRRDDYPYRPSGRRVL